MHKHGHSHSHGHGHSHFLSGDSEKHQHVKWASVTKLAKLALPEFGFLSIGLISLLISAGVNLIMPAAMGRIFDAEGRTGAWEVVRVLLGIFAAGVVFTFLRTFMFGYAGERLVQRLRKDLFGNIMIQDVAFFDKNKTGELVNRLSADTTVIQLAATSTLANFLKFLLQVAGGIVALLFLSWKLTFAMLAPLPLLLIFGYFYGRYVRYLSRLIQSALAKCTSIAEESISSLRYVRSFGNEDRETARYGNAVKGVFLIGKRIAVSLGLYQAGAELVAYICIIIVIFYGTILYLEKDLSQGDFLSFILYAIYVSHALGAVSAQAGEFMRAVGASDRVFELLDRNPDINISGGDTLNSSTLEGRIQFKDVSFSYPSRSDVPILTSFSLDLQPNKVTALVGPSGGGKTTIAQLILRLYDVQKGDITLDGRSIKELDPRWLREQVGFVSQEPILFNTTIRENISYGRPDATHDEIKESCIASHIDDFIESLPDSYETIVGERGVRLSGGQKQRVAIARAILKKPKILVLDEATSALDAESEHLVQMALDKIMKSRTVLVIAHRLSTVKNADIVAVISNGNVVEIGKHDDLISNENGLYHHLVNRQLQQTESLSSTNDVNDTKK